MELPTQVRPCAAGCAQLAAAGALAAALIVSANASAQTLTLADAMARAKAATPAARALVSERAAAEERVRQARAGYLPRVDLLEGVQRGNQPVYAFGSLLNQRRFTADDFAIERLNHPDPLTNVRTTFSIEQPVFDAGLTRLGVKGAEISRDAVDAAAVGSGQNLAMIAARAFVRVLELESAVRASEAAVAAADSDLERVRARRDSGLVTEADVLDLEVHAADMRQRRLSVAADLEVARLRLNDAIGVPLDTAVTLALPLPPSSPAAAEELVREALATRPDRRVADLQVLLAANRRRLARSAFLPRVFAQGGWELNGESFGAQRSNWIVGAQVQLNLFRGFGDAARVAEAGHDERRAAAAREGLDRAIDVDVRAALAGLAAARAREQVGRAALDQAKESQRIVRDRYETGLATSGDLLRASGAVLDAESRATAAQMDVILQGIALDRAVGRL